MSDFLGAVVRRAIGEPTGLRPAAQPWIPAADQHGRGAAGGHAVPPGDPRLAKGAGPEDGSLEVPPRFIDAGHEPVEPAVATTLERRPVRKRGSRPVVDGAGTRHPSSEAPYDDPGSVDAPPTEAVRSDRPQPSEPALAVPATRRRNRPPALIEAVADAEEVVPVVARAVALPRRPGPVRPDNTLRPLAAVDMSIDDPRAGGARPPDVDDQGPTVHVSIGRIEVRAPQPPAPRPAPTPVAPGLTLDAYLRGRDQDERR